MRQGFTLAELLIALALLGVIATFTIPKVLQNQQDSKRKAVFREVYSSLSAVLYEGVRSRSVQAGNFGTYMMDNLNTVKRCNTDATAQGCWTAAQGGPGVEPSEPGFVMHNGATLIGFDAGVDLGGGQHATGIYVDWNGALPPNTEGNDQIYWVACFGTVSCPGAFLIDSNHPNSPGLMGPYGGSATSIAMHSELFKN